MLDKRSATFLGSVGYQLITQAGLFNFGVGSDLGDKHNGLYAEAVWALPIRMEKWGVTPQVGYAYNSGRINNYLYGVSEAESARSGLAQFDADWDGQYFAGLSSYAFLSKKIRITAAIRYTNLEGEIENSPIIERTAINSGSIGISYIF